LKRFVALLLKYKITLLAVLKPLGFWGMGALAFIDSSSIPVPMDLIVAGYVWSDKPHFWVYCLMAAAGSMLGGLIPFFLGRAGGELFLLKRIDRQRFEKLRDRFEKQEFLALMIPSILPPPTPWKLFVFGAGVFEMKTVDFMAAVFVGRLIRFLALSGLTIRYGPQIVGVVADLAKRHTLALFLALGVVVAALVLWVMRKGFLKRQPAQEQIL
jgi:membrane protein YqaA with SNARE-associated domain